MTAVETMFKAFMEAALWSSTWDDGDGNGELPLDKKYTIADFDQKDLDYLKGQVIEFLNLNKTMIGDELEKAGHDFWLTRNHHGAGFWDGDWEEQKGIALTNACRRFKEVSIYPATDGKLYII